MPPILCTYFKHHPASFPHPFSLIALIPLSVITMQNKKQKCSFQLQSPTPLITVSSYFIFSTPISLLILPRLSTLHAIRPMNSIGGAPTLFCLLHFILAINCQASQFKLTEMAYNLPKILSVSSKTLHSCSLIMSSLRYFTPHTDSTNSRILFSKITLPNWPSSLPAFPSTFLYMTPNPLRAPEWASCPRSQSLRLFYLQTATPS